MYEQSVAAQVVRPVFPAGQAQFFPRASSQAAQTLAKASMGLQDTNAFMQGAAIDGSWFMPLPQATNGYARVLAPATLLARQGLTCAQWSQMDPGTKAARVQAYYSTLACGNGAPVVPGMGYTICFPPNLTDVQQGVAKMDSYCGIQNFSQNLARTTRFFPAGQAAASNALGQVVDPATGAPVVDTTGKPVTVPGTTATTALDAHGNPVTLTQAPAMNPTMGAALMSLAVSVLVIGGAAAVGSYYGARGAVEHAPRRRTETRSSRRSAR